MPSNIIDEQSIIVLSYSDSDGEVDPAQNTIDRILNQTSSGWNTDSLDGHDILEGSGNEERTQGCGLPAEAGESKSN